MKVKAKKKFELQIYVQIILFKYFLFQRMNLFENEIVINKLKILKNQTEVV